MKQKKFPVWTAGVIIGVVFLIFGIINDQFTDIFRKAAMICLECIGIG